MRNRTNLRSSAEYKQPGLNTTILIHPRPPFPAPTPTAASKEVPGNSTKPKTVFFGTADQKYKRQIYYKVIFMTRLFIDYKKQDARYAPGYFPHSIERGNRKFTSSLVKRNLLRI